MLKIDSTVDITHSNGLNHAYAHVLSRVSVTAAAAHLDHVQVFPLCRCMQKGETFVVLTGCVCVEHVQEVLEAVQLPFLGSKVHCICACERRGKGRRGKGRGGKGGEGWGGEGRGGEGRGGEGREGEGKGGGGEGRGGEGRERSAMYIINMYSCMCPV